MVLYDRVWLSCRAVYSALMQRRIRDSSDNEAALNTSIPEPDVDSYDLESGENTLNLLSEHSSGKG